MWVYFLAHVPCLGYTVFKQFHWLQEAEVLGANEWQKWVSLFWGKTMSYPLCFLLYLLSREGSWEKSKVKYIQHKESAIRFFHGQQLHRKWLVYMRQRRGSLSFLDCICKHNIGEFFCQWPNKHHPFWSLLFGCACYYSPLQLTAKETENYVPSEGKWVHLYLLVNQNPMAFESSLNRY